MIIVLVVLDSFGTYRRNIQNRRFDSRNIDKMYSRRRDDDCIGNEMTD